MNCKKMAFLSSEKNCSSSSESVRRTRALRSVGGEARGERNRGNAVPETERRVRSYSNFRDGFISKPPERLF